MTATDRLAIVPVRGGVLPAGADEAIVAAQGRALLVGDGTAAALAATDGLATHVVVAETPRYRPAAWAIALRRAADIARVVVCPGSPDARDLAPRLAASLDRPLVTGVVELGDDTAVVTRHGGRVEHDVAVDQPCVVVLQKGAIGVERIEARRPKVHELELELPDVADPDLVELQPADPATIDLVEADRVVAGGAGLGEPAMLDALGRIGLHLGASLGATRVLTDAGWIAHERQIGTTGVEITPELYLAFGISGAVQHLMGIGDPEHVIAVNTDPSCPMMARADLAVVADAPAVVAALARHLGVDQ